MYVDKKFLIGQKPKMIRFNSRNFAFKIKHTYYSGKKYIIFNLIEIFRLIFLS